MMSDSNFNIAKLSAQQHLSLSSHMVNASPGQSTYFNTAQSQMPQHQHYTQSLYGHTGQFALTSNSSGLEKSTYISGVGSTLSNINNGQRFFGTGRAVTTTTGSTPPNCTTAPSNTILITNNFTQQQNPTTNNTVASTGNISFISSTAAPIASVASGTSIPPTQQHTMYNINNNSLNKDVQQLFPTHLVQHQHHAQTQQQQSNFVASPSELIPHQFHGMTEAVPTTFHSSTAQVAGQAAVVSHGYYVAQETTAPPENSTSQFAQKIFSNANVNHVPTMSIDKDSRMINISGTTNATTSSTVVLDRINICINNLYTDTTCTAINNNSLNSTSSVQQQHSPIIPAIQHKTIIDSSSVVGILPLSSSLNLNDDSYESNSLIIDEPDSTTTAVTPQTPPVTPEAISSSFSILESGASNSSGNKSHCHGHSSISDSLNSNNGNRITTTTNLIDHSNFCSSTVEKICENMTNINIPKMAESHIEEGSIQGKLSNRQVNETSINTERMKNYPTSSSLQSASELPSVEATITTQTTLLSSISLTTTSSSLPSSSTNCSLTISKKSKNDSLSKQIPLSTLMPAPALTFAINEDVFVKRKDGRFYLGTVMEYTLPKYRICFDDKTEVWCSPSEMRKLSINAHSLSSSAVATCSSKIPNNIQRHYHSNNQHNQHLPPICVACKLTIPDAKVEVCERCGRGYHRHCTRETEQGNGVWLCKRCGKSMKLCHIDNKECHDVERCLNFPYNESVLHWDKKHQTNKEKIYCYCGKMGNYEQNMLQCCRCLNWFHIKCTESFHFQEKKLYRGDRFYVFSCSVCNQGPEFFQRLQINWNDLVHLILYNLSFTNYHQKYHHLNKDILPYAMKIRTELPIPHKWINMPDEEFKEHIRDTLNGNKERFKCNRDLVKHDLFYGLRCMQPPVIANIKVRRSDVLNDTFLKDTLNLKLLVRSSSPLEALSQAISPLNQKIKKNGQKNLESESTEGVSTNIKATIRNVRDVYEFRLDDEDNRIVENNSSEDEIPIKHIMEKVKKSLEKMDVEDDNANDVMLTVQRQQAQKPQQQKQDELFNKEKDNSTDELKEQEEEIIQTPDILVEEKSSSETAMSNEYDDNHTNHHQIKDDNMKPLTLAAPMKSRRKRKAFTTMLSEINYDAKLIQRLREVSSSDENSSSSSPSTSLDLIIPPPKNFLGQNNPFRMLTAPKMRNEQERDSLKLDGTLNSTKTATIPAIRTTTMSLNLSSKLAALKSAGIFPNLSTTNLAKAAGQGSRTVRTIKRRLSAKDITIGPNKEVKRKRNLSRRRLSSNVEVISTTTIDINPIPTNFFPIHAKDLLATVPVNASLASSLFFKQQQQKAKQQRQQAKTMKRMKIIGNTDANSNNSTVKESLNILNNNNCNNNSKYKLTSVPNQTESASLGNGNENIIQQPNHHGRRLRQRPQKISSHTSRRSSISSNSSSTCNSTVVGPLMVNGPLNPAHNDGGAAVTTITSTSRSATSTTVTATNSCNLNNGLKQTVNKYFGVVNRIESGEKFSIRAKRLLPNGQVQYLIEWGEPSSAFSLPSPPPSSSSISTPTVSYPNEVQMQNIDNRGDYNGRNENINNCKDRDDKGIEIINEFIVTSVITTECIRKTQCDESIKNGNIEKQTSLPSIEAPTRTAPSLK